MLTVKDVRQASKAQKDKSVADQRNRANRAALVGDVRDHSRDKGTKLSMQVSDKYKSDVNEAIRGMLRRNYHPDDVKMGESMIEKAKSRYSRDMDILVAYDADAMRARSFMSAPRTKYNVKPRTKK